MAGSDPGFAVSGALGSGWNISELISEIFNCGNTHNKPVSTVAGRCTMVNPVQP